MFRARIGTKTHYPTGELEEYFKPYRQQIIGSNQRIKTPYGYKKMIYADWTASGRLYQPLESKLMNAIGPFIGNTHTESTVTGMTTTEAYEEAKHIIKNHVNARADDILVATGTGMTDAVNKLQRLLGIRAPEGLQKKIKIKEVDRPVIFVSHMEHHSNYLSWKETIGDVIMLPPDKKGNIDTEELKSNLHLYANRKTKIGAFTACSNVTGFQTDYHQLAKIMHEHGGICFVDFAASAPYNDINMHPTHPLEKLDGILFSPHKFLGGPGSSGILIVSEKLITSDIPDNPGGGTVLWTDKWGGYKYDDQLEAREDGGTPGFLQLIRAALAIRLKEAMGTEEMHFRKQEILKLFIPALENINGIDILGYPSTQPCLGIIAFCAKDIHHHLFVKLLNDRFGIQTRGGCSCAGPYGHYLLNIDSSLSEKMVQSVEAGNMSLKPGWVRISFHPVMSNQEIKDTIQAIQLVMNNVHKWEKDYIYDANKDTFIYKNEKEKSNVNLNQLFTF
ncbi:putative cysteine desulfurase [Paraliobacillus sp. PM-2]|uniref:aminotransferase class V-fold PLP-dependent enzyme n=1 Tax=Paraliobacillus sp. PM-2 TaxID=1462524 RepID=UPI00061BDA19|nr:aminotransferase class V-fold PLP-dependent enzyme [Paraliobacillus sp. PM-2]CQR45992.1 putative cysteine desulfurase [Paraliobacillus sp. PM-2]